MLVEVVIPALWFMIPAYVANPSAVLFGGGRPMDSGKSLSDGKRVFGDGKTWRGFIGGVFAGIFIGLVLHGLAHFLYIEVLIFDPWFPNALFIISLLALGSMTGDLVGSFVKRRLDFKRGSKTPFIDIYSFLLITFLILLVFQWNWTVAHYFYNEYIIGFITVMVATPLLHRGVNIIGHRMGRKDVPW
jgi:CDP-2,3-bis-(O-geranylgeranyl)-sn-glycerol synthase